MKIAVLGTGTVGRAIGGRLTQLGHDVMIGTRDVAETQARTAPDRMGNPPFSEWHRQHPKIKLGTFAQAATHGELVVNATSGFATLEILKSAAEANLNGKTLIDISNPLDFSKGMPPTLFVKDTDSLAEQIQRAYPRVNVVKALNTMTASLMVNPGQLAGGDHTVFMSGNDAAAKAQVAELLKSFGWRDIIDVGDITTARGTEMLLPIWIRLMGKLGTPLFNFAIVK
ncbi:MAG: NAD(P)-binding domain-containing protein [Chloroflexi bacterium]|nr:NAD(P)-binding domain-containing protein [Chloroflexota bacterium]